MEASEQGECFPERANKIIAAYLLEKSEGFRRLAGLRQQGWSNPEGDRFFQKQRQTADEGGDKIAIVFYRLMKRIGQELHQSVNAFAVDQQSSRSVTILDLCMAPGGFLETSMRHNPNSTALAFSLPPSSGGHKVLLPKNPLVDVRFLDVTMLAEDMGVQSIPPDHPDVDSFLPRQFMENQRFDLVLCDGQVLRTHARSQYRDRGEARRLTTTQLALGLEHLREGGTMIILLHKLEAWETARLLWQFHEFSSVKLWKPKAGHTKRSSFYMIAANVQSLHPVATKAIENWKATWKVATFGSDEEYSEFVRKSEVGVDEMLEKFGERLIELGEEIWEVQAVALAKSPFIRG